MELREMRTFIAVVEAGGLSAAARRLHVSQPAVSQTVAALERELGVTLLVRGRDGVRATDAGMTLLAEARAVLARHDRAVAAVTGHAVPGGRLLRLGIPIELPDEVLLPAIADLARTCPGTTVRARHLSTADQHTALLAGELEMGLLRERPAGPSLDAMLVVEERLGVLLSAERAAELAAPAAGPGTAGQAAGGHGHTAEGVRLDALAGLDWVGFPRSGSPAWYDEVTAVLRTHGVDLGPEGSYGEAGIAHVKFAAVGGGRAFALAPPNWAQPLPEFVRRLPLIGHPLVRRTWAVWPADATRRDLGHLVTALGQRVLG
ncbi:LysR family transcriptional regulator [Streptomyces sp. NBC_01497]|uniref:LysR family transcriptional regulator n=1 Tax=Streptomyces sp. NBC_01497 TaxID=2903885 RepID=UPI002E2EC9BA|nr:LysR family transcriptional regulator [Streptomyces sp. NBC_01497]